ncbi:NAD-dependent epimerase/dehydratase family protein [Magnetospirillum sp. SS-4]|uniref:NAD-dependent epimerase/dehydratase family protein n=1 Tax=Magnetospirillum sp. SS-4 TaxID=2681465 RepID=UPI00137D5BFE|nr:NAD-dependent epimerase/dehydratase family protein [Magnetospirillum sp. SS-4]CAA7619870.1 NAD-dependent epimerase/dehydratase [Magnetospirillum sp. SS-4]
MTSPAVAAADYAGRNVLVTGASGFVGGSIVRHLLGTGCRIRRHARRSLAPLDCWSLGDSSDDPMAQATWDEALDGIDVVFHCAAQTSVYQAAADPVGDLEANVALSLRLLEAARRQPRPVTVIMASTATVFGLPESLPVRHGDRPAPVTAYDAGKLAAEGYLALYARLGQISGGALRLANVYGPGPSSSTADRGVLNKVVQKALAGGPVTVFDDGRWVRDYVFIDDVVAAFLLAGSHGEALAGQACLVCSGAGTTVAEAFRLAVEVVAERTGRPPAAVESVASPAGLSAIEFRDFVGTWDALAAATGWRPLTGLRAGIGKTVDDALTRTVR